jgi:hypothetical protein
VKSIGFIDSGTKSLNINKDVIGAGSRKIFRVLSFMSHVWNCVALMKHEPVLFCFCLVLAAVRRTPPIISADLRPQRRDGLELG